MDVYFLQIMGVDLILGASWLTTLGPHVTNYHNLYIQFVVDNQLITLKGDKNL